MAQYHKLFLNSNWILFEVQSQTEIRLISNQRAINRTIARPSKRSSKPLPPISRPRPPNDLRRYYMESGWDKLYRVEN